jgi:hypothetical protein
MGWPHVWSTIGGVPILVSGGQLDIPTNCTDPFCNRNPRTGIGFTSDGTLLMVVVDGRSPKSRGMTLVQFARLFMRLGATDALNLDGGGSATMVVKGRVVNHPSDTTGERAVTSSALILPQVLRAMGVRASGPAGPGPGSAARAALSDPGSTGGMLDSVARGTFGPVRLGAAERRVVAAFRRG